MKVLVILCLVGVSLGVPTGLVGPSGSIGPSGIVGPSGPVQFHQPAWAFFGNAAHAHLAALNRVQAPAHVHHHVPVHHQPAPANVAYGVDAAGCLTGPSGKVCPTGNIQFTA
ncbi:uncharacterized protein LOC143020575 [Oratosquilla oratoria]|uniref:uncharacterized protein LOC143020575 n=1 Tax=Oratosquilla oratoria TaxID=337810 RepID=UPI003F773F73